jgi:hypothetical protein
MEHHRIVILSALALAVAIASCDKDHDGERKHGQGGDSLVVASLADISAGEFVRAELDDTTYPYVASRLELGAVAGRAQHRNGANDGDQDHGEQAKVPEGPDAAEGLITAIDPSSGTFKLLGLHVAVDDATVFEGVSALKDLDLGQRAEVRGALGNGGFFYATSVRTGRNELAGRVLAIVPIDDGVKIDVLGRTVLVTPVTEVVRREHHRTHGEDHH